ncbi:MAG TPA: cytochrome-c oxidase [Dongiaceae bacterium]|nr:cytochrome-c oxidase [Dongiaceae bacterium]
MSNSLLRIAVAYWVVAVGWGIYMGATEDFTDIAVHAHLNLLGWVSLGLCGIIYAQAPHLAETLLAKAHFWLHNLGLPVLMLGVWFIKHGQPEVGGPIAGIFSIVMGVGILAFGVNLWRGGFPKPAHEHRAAATAAARG